MGNVFFSIRQGDVLLILTTSIPQNCQLVPLENNRIVLAHGETTGHAHAIADHGQALCPNSALEMATAAIARAKAKLWIDDSGDRYLEVIDTVNLTHEEHTAHSIPAGIYYIPQQVEYTPKELIRVAD